MTFNIATFVNKIKDVQGDLLFNPYTDLCPINDLENAVNIRVDNLFEFLHGTSISDILIIGEAPGHLGCRRTGLPFTDERHLELAGNKLRRTFKKATYQGKDKEASALHVWKILKHVDPIPMVWNIIPVHPHKKDNPLSNRGPLREDHYLSTEVIDYLMKSRNWKKIYAIGNQAHNQLNRIGFQSEKVRHPSHGGSNIFKKAMTKAFGINSETQKVLGDYIQ